MAHEDTKRIVALSLLILLYALVPILLFFLAVGAIFDVLYLISFIETRDPMYGFFFMVLTLALFVLIYLIRRLLSWLKR